MVMTVDIPEKLMDQAKAQGLSVEAYLRDTFANAAPEQTTPGFVRIAGSRSSPEARQRAVTAIREIAGRNSLAGLTIRELIDAGRKY